MTNQSPFARFAVIGSLELEAGDAAELTWSEFESTYDFLDEYDLIKVFALPAGGSAKVRIGTQAHLTIERTV